MSNAARDPNVEEPRGPKLQPLMPPVPTSDIASIKEAKAAVGDFSIVVGGPVYDFLLRIGLVRLDLPNILGASLAPIEPQFLTLLFWRRLTP
jgi:hypothetical protein